MAGGSLTSSSRLMAEGSLPADDSRLVVERLCSGFPSLWPYLWHDSGRSYLSLFSVYMILLPSKQSSHVCIYHLLYRQTSLVVSNIRLKTEV